ncbi:TLD family protein [Histomonas meleagridis]|uniref:TLD family protein n=1 Tax=Histomonas meleagridis TaxID=135588 RepID=UPI00355A233C|nr:TLD family protein [Histomonas meleagridis]KAH0800153.1 TLD family protein [Histomonas meleagridis]
MDKENNPNNPHDFAEEEEEASVVGVVTLNDQDCPARIYLRNQHIFIELDQGFISESFAWLKDHKTIDIDMTGLLDTQIIPHPSISDDVPFEDFSPATIVLAYLDDLFDNYSLTTLNFSALNYELKEFKDVIEKTSDELKKRVMFDPPKVKVNNPRPKVNEKFQLVNGTSQILTMEEINTLRLALPTRVRRHQWELIYNTSVDGFSINSLSIASSKLMPLLIVINTTDRIRIGAYLSCGLKPTKGFSGTGETFVFNFKPFIQIYRWSKANQYFVSITKEELIIGGGNAKAAIYLTNGLRDGFSDQCETFNSPMLTNRNKFQVGAIEVWYIRSMFANRTT